MSHLMLLWAKVENQDTGYIISFDDDFIFVTRNNIYNRIDFIRLKDKVNIGNFLFTYMDERVQRICLSRLNQKTTIYVEDYFDCILDKLSSCDIYCGFTVKFVNSFTNPAVHSELRFKNVGVGKNDTVPVVSLSTDNILSYGVNWLKEWYFGEFDNKYYVLCADKFNVRLDIRNKTKLLEKRKGKYYNMVLRQNEPQFLDLQKYAGSLIVMPMIFNSIPAFSGAVNNIKNVTGVCKPYSSSALKRLERINNEEEKFSEAVYRYNILKG